jgi:cation:H+ antiporter
MTWLIYVLVIVVATAVIWVGSDWLETASQQLSLHYGLPPAVHGAVVVAVGSSFPELSSTVLSTLIHGDFELGLSAVIGSAIFNLLVITGLSGLAAPNRLTTNLELVYKDAQFYLTSIAVLLCTLTLAVVYAPVPQQPLTGTLHGWLAWVPLALYGVYLFLQQQSTSDYTPEAPPDASLRPGLAWLKLLGSLIFIVVGVEGLVRAALFFGDYFGTPSFVWGILVIASVTSLPDAVVSVRLARHGESISSLSNVLGSNIFDLLVAVPLGVLIAGSAQVNLGVALPLMAFLSLVTIQLFVSIRLGLSLSQLESWLLLASYGVFVLWILLEATGVMDLLPAGGS